MRMQHNRPNCVAWSLEGISEKRGAFHISRWPLREEASFEISHPNLQPPLGEEVLLRGESSVDCGLAHVCRVANDWVADLVD